MIAAGWLCAAAIVGCQRAEVAEVVVYTAHDREFSEALLAEFTAETGIRVRAKYDSEANKSVGLTSLILQEARRPRCDLFWNNEILNTLRLDRAGLLAARRSAEGEKYPAEFRSPNHTWYGFAARARVLLVNRRLLGDRPLPRTLEDLLQPVYEGRVGLAKPLFGTTATHAACLFSAWGNERAREFFAAYRTQGQVFPGNRQVAQAVGAGQILFGLTDTDDALGELEGGRDVAIIFPDQSEGQLGTLLIPNTLGIVRGSPHAAASERLREYLLQAEVEGRLAAGRSGQLPLHPEPPVRSRLELPANLKTWAVDWDAAAGVWEESARILQELGY